MRLPHILPITTALLVGAVLLPASVFAWDQYGPEPQDCTAFHPCLTAQLAAAQAARAQATQTAAAAQSAQQAAALKAQQDAQAAAKAAALKAQQDAQAAAKAAADAKAA